MQRRTHVQQTTGISTKLSNEPKLEALACSWTETLTMELGLNLSTAL